MPLTNVQIRPGFNKSDTPSGAEGQWIDGDFVRFRYGQPEKIGGFTAIGQKTIAGPARAQHTWNDLEGRKYAVLGTSKALYIYYEDAFYDVTPLDTQPGTASFSSTTGSSTVTVTLTSHTLLDKEYITFSSVTLPGGGVTGYGSSDFTNTTFEITNITTNTFDIVMPSNETGTGMSTAGTATVEAYEEIGPTIQTYGYGWGTGLFGGSLTGASSTLLNGALNDDAFGTGGSPSTQVTVDSTTGFPSAGTILVGSELISYTSTNATNFLGITRAVSGSTRFLDPVNTAVGLARGSDFKMVNRKEGSETLNNSLRYMDQIIAVVSGEDISEEKFNAATGKITLDAAKQLGYREVEMTDTKKMLSIIGRPTYLANLRTKSAEADNRFNNIFHEIIEHKASKLLRNSRFREGKGKARTQPLLDFRTVLVNAVLRDAKATTLTFMKRGVYDVDDIVLSKMIDIGSKYKWADIDRGLAIMQEKSEEKVEFKDLTDEQLDTLEAYLEFEKRLEERAKKSLN